MSSDGGGEEAAVLAAAEDMANGAGDEAGLDDIVGTRSKGGDSKSLD
jgi:hypothetical protein